MNPPRKWLSQGDPEWPSRLDNLAAVHRYLAVPHIWIEGQLPQLPCVAVVGARRVSAAGLEIARRIGADLARHGCAVVSGFARGVDAAAHRGCLDVGGVTVAVLAAGLDVDYPLQHRELRAEIIARGALVTEYEPGEQPEGWRFPRRNRIIAALAHAIIVVEAGERSGALITARWAADLGTDVLAVPGSILGPAIVGSNLLLRDGVAPYLDISDLSRVSGELADLLHGAAPVRLAGAGGNGDLHRDVASGNTEADQLLDLLGPEPIPREILGRALQMSAARLAVVLGELELTGTITCLPGGLVVRPVPQRGSL